MLGLKVVSYIADALFPSARKSRVVGLSEEQHTESSWDTNDETLAGSKLLLEVHLVVRCILDERDAWDAVSGFDHDCGWM
jgi:hypothetical protein